MFAHTSLSKAAKTASNQGCERVADNMFSAAVSKSDRRFLSIEVGKGPKMLVLSTLRVYYR